MLNKESSRLLDALVSSFNEDYHRWFIANESKPQSVGRPRVLHRSGRRPGLLLLHGYMSAPEKMEPCARYFFELGFNCVIPRLAGHGTSPDDLATRSRHDWSASAEEGRVLLRSMSDTCVVAGFSTGSLLALQHAARHPADYKAVLSVSAPLYLRGMGPVLAPALDCLLQLAGRMTAPQRLPRFIVNHPDNPQINYLRNPVHGVAELRRLARDVHRLLPEISIPLLTMQAADDPVVDPWSVETQLRRCASSVKARYYLPAACHGIIRGQHERETWRVMESFLRQTGLLSEHI